LSRLWPIVRREYLERVRSKAFLIATLLGPILMVVLTLAPALLMGRTGKPLRLALLDETGRLATPVRASLATRKLQEQARFIVEPLSAGAEGAGEATLKARVLEGDLDGFLKLPAGTLEGAGAEYYGKTVSNMIDLRLIEESVSAAVIAERLAGAGVDRARVEELTRGVDLKPVRVSATGEREDRGAGFVLSFILVMMLYTTVLMWGQAVLTSVIEEKSSRVVEVIVSAVPSRYLLAGKLLGVGAAGLTQFLAWVLTLLLLSLFGAGLSLSLGMGKLPEVSPLTLVFFLVYFLLGFLMYAALFAALGSCVNTTQEAQSLAFPVFMPLILAVMFIMPVVQAPDSGLSIGLSLFPFFTPLLMFLRISVLQPPAWQIALSMVLTLLTIVGIVFVAARIYRVGILMYGKRPTFPEIMRWVGRA
jgi:ABC-2 type transport system permease protein